LMKASGMVAVPQDGRDGEEEKEGGREREGQG